MRGKSGEVARRRDRGERVRERGFSTREAVRAAAGVEGAVDAARRRLRHAGRDDEDDRVLGRQLEPLERRPVARPELRSARKKNGTSAPTRAATCASSSGSSGSSSDSFASESAVAASLLPPPSPAATGIRFSMRTRQRGSHPAALASASSAVADDRVLDESLDDERIRRLDRDRVVQVDPLQHRDDVVLSVVASPPTTSARLIFAYAAADAHRSAPPADELRRRELLRTRVRRPPDRRERLLDVALASRPPTGRARWRPSCAGARTRASTTGLTSAIGADLLALERDERRLDARPRAKDRRRNRVEAGLARRELDQDGHGAVRLRPRLGEEAIGDLPLDHDAPLHERLRVLQRLDDERRRDVVGEVRDELRTAVVAARRPRCGARRPRRSRTFGRPSSALAERGLERAIELDRVDDAHAVGEVAGQDSEPRADLERRRRSRRGRSCGR